MERRNDMRLHREEGDSVRMSVSWRQADRQTGRQADEPGHGRREWQREKGTLQDGQEGWSDLDMRMAEVV